MQTVLFYRKPLVLSPPPPPIRNPRLGPRSKEGEERQREGCFFFAHPRLKDENAWGEEEGKKPFFSRAKKTDGGIACFPQQKKNQEKERISIIIASGSDFGWMAAQWAFRKRFFVLRLLFLSRFFAFYGELRCSLIWPIILTNGFQTGAKKYRNKTGSENPV